MDYLENGERPASPITPAGYEEDISGEYEGLTKREHFAGLAMQGLIGDKMFADMGAYGASQLLGIDEEKYIGQRDFPKLLSKFSVQYADALLKALEAE
tara:strand:+ start:466 stop:759 length:294 start_codon:yes stop_codon:yes gene_type:complete